ncbi:Ribonuclease BN [bacterium HR31]|nr:Ribonuclease BN [bacterium HR31]
MRVWVLGRCGGYPRPGEACSGYLVEAAGRRVLLDLGHGALSRLLVHLSPYDLDAVVVSHLHPDHVADLPALRVALRWGRRPASWAGRLPVLGPAQAAEYLAHVVGEPVLEEFDFYAIAEAEPVELDGLRLRFCRTRHPVETYAVRLESQGAVLVYTADTAPSDAVRDLSRGADVLLAEATLSEAYRDRADAAGHLTGSLAGALAHEAGVRRLLLTHFFPTTDPQESVTAAQKAFVGPVGAVEEGASYEV